MKEIHRVLKPNGWFLVSCPIHIHGAMEFVAGDMPKILSYFDTDLWGVSTEEWRKDYDPLPPYEAWVYKGKTIEKFKESIFKNSTQNYPSGWELFVKLRKK
jgi:SAM-dependent methyltransferase